MLLIYILPPLARPTLSLLHFVCQVEEESMALVYEIEKIGSRSGAPSEKVEITDSGML